MSVSYAQTDPHVVLQGVPWNVYVGLTNALGEFQPRHTYDRGTLELRSVLHGVPWKSYLAFLDALGDYNLRHTYDRGKLEMMSPLKVHEWPKGLLGRMIEAMALELDVPIQSVGSTTFHAEAAERGLQPDESYYIQNESLVRGKDHHDPQHDPPPDLVIEVDVTNSCLDRLPVYAALGVPELWRFDGESVVIHGLNDSGDQAQYEPLQASRAFPFVRPHDVSRFLDMRHGTDENSLVRAFVQWARESSEASG